MSDAQPNPHIIVGLDPTPTDEDRRNYDLIVNTPDEAGAREVADLRVRAFWAGIEWAANLVVDYMDYHETQNAKNELLNALAAHDAAVGERKGRHAPA
jgi:hypothetical protein